MGSRVQCPLDITSKWRREFKWQMKFMKSISSSRKGKSTGGRESTYDEYLEKLPDDACKYGLYDFEFEHACEGAEDTMRSKLILMIWCPDTCKIKEKMLYSSSFDALKHALEGIGKYIQATDKSEATSEVVTEKIKSTARS